MSPGKLSSTLHSCKARNICPWQPQPHTNSPLLLCPGWLDYTWTNSAMQIWKHCGICSRLKDLGLVAHPTDEDSRMLARLTTLLDIKHQFRVCQLPYLFCDKAVFSEGSSNFYCNVVDDSAHYHENPTHADADIFMIISLPKSPLCFEVYMWWGVSDSCGMGIEADTWA